MISDTPLPTQTQTQACGGDGERGGRGGDDWRLSALLSLNVSPYLSDFVYECVVCRLFDMLNDVICCS